jgi:hypothetical protein
MPEKDELDGKARDPKASEGEDAAPEGGRKVRAGEPRDHGSRALRIAASVAGSGSYLARFDWSLARVGSLESYGRYSSISRAQRSAFGTPAAVRAATSSSDVAVLAETRVTAAEGSADPEAPPDDAAEVGAAVALGATVPRPAVLPEHAARETAIAAVRTTR